MERGGDLGQLGGIWRSFRQFEGCDWVLGCEEELDGNRGDRGGRSHGCFRGNRVAFGGKKEYQVWDVDVVDQCRHCVVFLSTAKASRSSC